MKFLCLCDQVVQTSGPMPHPHEWLFLSDTEYDEVVGSVDAEALYGRFGHAFRCQHCETLWVYQDGLEHPARAYAPVADERLDAGSVVCGHTANASTVQAALDGLDLTGALLARVTSSAMVAGAEIELALPSDGSRWRALVSRADGVRALAIIGVLPTRPGIERFVRHAEDAAIVRVLAEPAAPAGMRIVIDWAGPRRLELVAAGVEIADPNRPPAMPLT